MNRIRKTHRGLTDSRIYSKRKRFYLFSDTPLVNPDSGKKAKWHSLCPIADGEHKARVLARRILDHNTQGKSEGDMPRLLRDWMAAVLKKREEKRPIDPMRVKMFETRNSDLLTINEVIARAFTEFSVSQVLPVDIASFVDQWEGRRMAQVYRSHLSKFFQWACRKGFRADNPTREVELEKPENRDVYITHEQFHAIRDALLVGNNGKRNPSGIMMQCYVDLCYLLYQRTTDVRLLKANEITPAGIYVRPTKTDTTSGGDVLIPMTPEIEAVIARAKAEQHVQSIYVICKPRGGQPYNATGLRTAWKRACARVGLSGLTLKDLRAKAATDAALSGAALDDLKTGMVHTSTGTTEGYVRVHETPVSSVTMPLPPRKTPSNK